MMITRQLSAATERLGDVTRDVDGYEMLGSSDGLGVLMAPSGSLTVVGRPEDTDWATVRGARLGVTLCRMRARKLLDEARQHAVRSGQIVQSCVGRRGFVSSAEDVWHETWHRPDWLWLDHDRHLFAVEIAGGPIDVVGAGRITTDVIRLHLVASVRRAGQRNVFKDMQYPGPSVRYQ
jgi:hypothetical protein